jgi:hypothetical protein
MAYRGPVEGVLQRCEELRARLERIEGKAVPGRACRDLEAALGWEIDLRRRLDALDARALEDAPLADIAVTVLITPPRTFGDGNVLRRVVFAVLIIATVVVFVVQFDPR